MTTPSDWWVVISPSDWWVVISPSDWWVVIYNQSDYSRCIPLFQGRFVKAKFNVIPWYIIRKSGGIDRIPRDALLDFRRAVCLNEIPRRRLASRILWLLTISIIIIFSFPPLIYSTQRGWYARYTRYHTLVGVEKFHLKTATDNASPRTEQSEMEKDGRSSLAACANFSQLC